MQEPQSAITTPTTVPEFGPLKLSSLNWADELSVPSGVPIWDYQRLLQGHHDKELRETLARGFPFYIRDYGIPDRETEAVFNIVRSFFNEPEQHKARMVHDVLPLILRGYSAYGTGAYENSLDNGRAVNQYVKYAWGADQNVYPNERFRSLMSSMFSKTNAVAHGVLGSIGRVLSLTEHEEWPNVFDGEDTVLHCQCYYPERPRGDGRMIAHADASTVTLLQQLPAENGHVGLRALMDGVYVGVPSIRGTLVVLVGESLNGLSNGRAKPVVHAVAGPTSNVETSERSSMPFFANPKNAFRMPRPTETTHAKFYNEVGPTRFEDYSRNIATAYAATENARV